MICTYLFRNFLSSFFETAIREHFDFVTILDIYCFPSSEKKARLIDDGIRIKQNWQTDNHDIFRLTRVSKQEE